MSMRVGIGYDVHQLTQDRPLIIGGVEIAWDKGLLGHSDADVLVHAIMDALLGAAGLGDIGLHFPDHEEIYRNCSSIALLEQVKHKLCHEGWQLVNIDAVIMAQKPKLLSHIADMKKNISHGLGIDNLCINIKATTTEGLGFVGSEEGIAAQAVVLIDKHA